MTSTLMVFHAVVSALLVIMVLLQFGKGAEAGLISGSGSDQVFSGAAKGNILTHITTILAILFLGNSILLAKLQSSGSSASIMDDEAPISRPLNQDKAAMPKTDPAVPVTQKKDTK